MRELIKGTFVIIALVLAVIGCQPPLDTRPAETKPTAEQPTFTAPDGKSVFVVNSTWKKLSQSDLPKNLSASFARATTMENYIAAVEAYNASNIDDYLRIYYDGVPDIEDAPNVSVYICNPITYRVNMAQVNIPRQSLVDNAHGWRQDAFGQLLFIDHVPPAPIVNLPLSQFAYWAIYGIDETGAIVYEDHCGYRSDEQFYQEDIGDYASPTIYYPLRIYQIQHEVTANPGWTLKADHTLYTPPVTP